MSTTEKIKTDMKAAMMAKDSARLGTIRMLMSELKNREIDKREALAEDEVMQTISSMVKKRRDAIDEARAAGREDIAEREMAEIAVLETYLPAQLSEAELDALVAAAIAQAGAAGPKDMGKVMQLVMPQIQGRADGKTVTAKVKSKLE